MTSRKDLAILIIAVGALLVGCSLLIASMLIPPPGEIDHSVLVAFGEISTFSAALLGVSFSSKNKKSQQI